MNSFISSFKPFAVALAAILCIESAVYAIARPNFVERSNYLDWNFLTGEFTHKIIIFEKLRQFAYTQPDLIQVGDSSGFFGIRPEIVMKYLNGLKYVNFSCCANTGYNGYYDIAKFVLERDAKAKAIVLYTTPNLPPDVRVLGGDKLVGGSDRLYDALLSPWASLSPPSQSLRPWVTNYVYFKGSDQNPMYPQGSIEARLRTTFQSSDGWFRELDERKTAEARAKYFAGPCGSADEFRPNFSGEKSFYTKDWLGRTEFVPEKVFSEFAALAASYNVKLIIAFQPHPCKTMNAQDLEILQRTLERVKEKYPNVSVVPEGVYEHWPKREFTGLNHLRTGYDVLVSQRLGRLVASALGIPALPADPPLPAAQTPDANAETPNLLSNDAFRPEPHMVGLTIDGPVEVATPSITKLTETKTTSFHHMATDAFSVVPRKPYVLSLEVKPTGSRLVSILLRDLDGNRQGSTTCNFPAGEVARADFTYDADIATLPDGWYRCWASMSFCTNKGIIDIYALDQNSSQLYAGDGVSGFSIRDLRLQQGWHLSPLSSSDPPYPNLATADEPCDNP